MYDVINLKEEEKDNTNDRRLTIFNLILQKDKGSTQKEIADFLKKNGFKASIKTIKRDLDVLSNNFYIYEEERVNQIYYIFDKSIRLKNVDINKISFIWMAKLALKNHAKILNIRCAIKTIDKILQNTSPEIQEFIQNLEENINIDFFDDCIEGLISDDIFSKLSYAEKNNRKVKIKYCDLNQNKTIRIIEPYTISIYKNCMHLFGICIEKNAMRDFRVSRIEEVEVLDLVFEKNLDILKSIENRSTNLINNEIIEIEILFDLDMKRYLQEYESKKIKFMNIIDEGILCKLEQFCTPELIRWILGFGSKAKVITPKTLSDKIKHEIKILNQKYNNNKDDDIV